MLVLLACCLNVTTTLGYGATLKNLPPRFGETESVSVAACLRLPVEWGVVGDAIQELLPLGAL